MKKCVLVCALLACTVAATNASAQIVANTAKRAGIGGSVGGYFTFDDEVNVGPAYGVNFGLAPAPGLGPTLGFGWYQGDLILSGVSGDREVGQLRIRPLMPFAGSWPDPPAPGGDAVFALRHGNPASGNCTLGPISGNSRV